MYILYSAYTSTVVFTGRYLQSVFYNSWPIRMWIPQNDADPIRSESGSTTLMFTLFFITTVDPDPKHCFTVHVLYFFLTQLTYVLQTLNMNRVPPLSFPTRKADRISRTRTTLCTGSTGAGRTSPAASGTSVWERTRSSVRHWSSWTRRGCSSPRSGLCGSGSAY